MVTTPVPHSPPHWTLDLCLPSGASQDVPREDPLLLSKQAGAVQEEREAAWPVRPDSVTRAEQKEHAWRWGDPPTALQHYQPLAHCNC